MSEAERLQKIVEKQGKEIGKLRRLLSTARVACADFEVHDNTLRVVCTCIGVDEYHFMEKLKPELEGIANAIIGARDSVTLNPSEAVDAITGEKPEGGVGA